eukprot:tig00000144_g9027.t1
MPPQAPYERVEDPASHLAGVRVYTAKFALPRLTCEHCVLRWTYTVPAPPPAPGPGARRRWGRQTGNTCNAVEGVPASLLADPSFVVPGLSPCGAKSGKLPEQNCADVRLSATGGPAPGCPSPANATAEAASPAPGPGKQDL